MIKEMLTSMWAGYFIGEKVVDQEKLKTTGKYLISHVTPMPPITTIFAVDEQGNVKDRNRLFQYIINSYTPGYQNMNLQGSFIGNFNNAGNYNNELIGIDPLASLGDLDYPARQPYIIGELQVFIQILQFYDQEIYKGLGIPPSMFDSGGGSYAQICQII